MSADFGPYLSLIHCTEKGNKVQTKEKTVQKRENDIV